MPATNRSDILENTAFGKDSHIIHWHILDFLRHIDYVLRSHSATALIIAWSIFLGPVLFLLPLVLAEELIFIVLHFVTMGLHGMSLGFSPALYYQQNRDDGLAIPSLFANLHSIGAKYSEAYNTATTKSTPLLIFRLLAAAVGVYILAGILKFW